MSQLDSNLLMLKGKNPPGHLTVTEKMPWSQRRDAANEKHMTGYECSHLNNSGVGGRQRGDARLQLGLP